VHAIVEARRAAPAILYLPHLTLWWDTAPASLRSTLWMLLADLPPDLPLLLFATADAPLSDIPHDALALFGREGVSGAHQMAPPSAIERAAMFDGISLQAAQPSKPRVARITRQPLPEVLPLLSYCLNFLKNSRVGLCIEGTFASSESSAFAPQVLILEPARSWCLIRGTHRKV
jgi:hypothetical protein